MYGQKQKWLHHPLLSWGPRCGQNGCMTHAVVGVPNVEEKIESSYITPTVSGAHMWAKWLLTTDLQGPQCWNISEIVTVTDSMCQELASLKSKKCDRFGGENASGLSEWNLIGVGVSIKGSLVLSAFLLRQTIHFFVFPRCSYVMEHDTTQVICCVGLVLACEPQQHIP